MTEGTTVPIPAVGDIVKRVAQKTLVLVAVAVTVVILVSIFNTSGQHWWLLPVSIVFGAFLGLVNFRWLAVTVERVYLRKGATPALSNLAAAFINMFKLAVIFIILFIVIKWRLLNIFGLVGGLSLCFLAILWQGLTLMKNVAADHQ